MRKPMWWRSLGAAILFLSIGVLGNRPAVAEVRLPKVLGSHMVLQQEKPLNIWGWAAANEAVTVQFQEQKQEAKANEHGEWKVVLPATKAGGPFTLTVTASNTITLDDVLVGEVWLCSGQSNMEMGIGNVREAQKEIAAADFPQIRLLKVEKKWAPQPQDDIGGEWKVCSPKTVAEGGWSGFSAAGYFFGRQLHQQLKVPVGLIDSSWGGTRIESWTPPEGFATVPELKAESAVIQMSNPHNPAYQQRMAPVLDATAQWLEAARKNLADQTLVPPPPAFPTDIQLPHDVQNATALYNGQIHPLVPFTLRGAIWYQGESNLGEGMLYAHHMKALVGGWRRIWNEGDFPFYFVQIAPFNYHNNPVTEAELWEAQATAAQVIPNVGMAVINDIGELGDIHPKNKQEVGRRLALLALAKTYNQPDTICSGPTFKALTIDNDKLRVTFDNAGTGLATRDHQPPTWFEIIDADGEAFVKADARIDGGAVVLQAPGVSHPTAVRYAWSMLAEPNLINSAGLPAGAFRTKPAVTDALASVAEAKEYQLVYDLDLAKLGHDITYDVDNHAKIQQSFDRIAYLVELQQDNGASRYVYVSVDAFTNDLGKIGIPTLASGAKFQQNLTRMNIMSNVKGIVTGTDLAGGNIEFWPNNYGPSNTAAVPAASNENYDFGDQPTDPADGYGSMQIHNHDAKQTLFAINNWRAGGAADIGIGNSPIAKNTDWTFAANAKSYTAKRIRVLVHAK